MQMFLEIHYWYKWLGCNMGKQPKKCMFYSLKVEQPDTLQHIKMTNSEMEMCM